MLDCQTFLTRHSWMWEELIEARYEDLNYAHEVGALLWFYVQLQEINQYDESYL